MMLTRSRHWKGSTLDGRTSTLTERPSLSRRLTRCVPIKPEAPVTIALAGAMFPHRLAVMFYLAHGNLRGVSRICGEIAIPACGQIHSAGERQWRPPAEQRAGLGAVEM